MSDISRAFAAALSDRYVVERQVGAGGMATVYLARDPRHKRLVALKIVRPELGGRMGVERFLREIELAAELQVARRNSLCVSTCSAAMWTNGAKFPVRGPDGGWRVPWPPHPGCSYHARNGIVEHVTSIALVGK